MGATVADGCKGGKRSEGAGSQGVNRDFFAVSVWFGDLAQLRRVFCSAVLAWFGRVSIFVVLAWFGRAFMRQI